MKLPKPYLSASQIDLWKRSKSQYIKRYFKGEKSFVTKEMKFGLEFEKELDQTQTEISCVIEGIKFVGIMDYFCEKDMRVREDKTGKVEWTDKRVSESVQGKLYSLMVLKNYDKIPTFELKWTETTEDCVGRIVETGNSYIFVMSYTAKELKEFEKEILQIAQDISDAYYRYLNEEPPSDAVRQYSLLKYKEAAIKEEIESLKPQVIKELDALSEKRMGELTLVKSKRWQYSDTVKEQVKELQENDAEKKQMEIVSIRYNS